ncbi:autotransporter-associated beta strand repeat-containing protein, partial [Cyanobium sp. LEGE 06143]|uniref:autotransporter-associated beta strand repeat-containing protein n=1 Tax=Cyanobium sp. LEGE 06143 TaxID=945727 RepID=UPI001D1559AD
MFVDHAGSRVDVQSYDVSWTGRIAGDGALNLLGNGLLVLTGENTYAGGTYVEAGTLAGAAGALQGDIANNGMVEFRQAEDGTYAGAMTGEGALRKTGAGVLLLTGANSYQGGTEIAEGALAGTSDSLQGDIVNNANLIFMQTTDGEYAGTVSGNGIFRKLGDGILELTGLNTYSGDPVVMQGVLAGNSASLQGTIWNGATVEFRETDAGAYAGQMSGEGTLRKTGEGALLLTGANTYSGGTDVSQGTLIGAAGALQGNISNAGIVEFRQVQDGLFSGNISGRGRVRKTGAGVLLMTGQNSYTGTTEVEEGTLMGAAAAIQGDVLNNGNVVFLQTDDGTFSGNMSGEGALIKLGEGRLELSGENSFTGDITVLEGVLAASHDANLGAGSLTIGNAVFQAADDMEISRELIIDHAASRMDVQENEVIWNGVISGDGALNLLGQGRLELTAENTYSGGTYVEQGVLAGAAGAIQGDVWNDGTVEFLQDEDGEYTGTIVGDGALRKLGNGLLRLTGQSGIAGNTFLDEGSLSVDGLLGTELLMVANNASLLGNGGIDGSVMVLSGGTLKPGNSPGTLYVSGDVTLSQGSVLEAEIDGRVWSAEGGAGSYDRIVLTGEGATFSAGGSINPLLRGINGDATNAFTPVIGDVFTIVSADNIAGTFDSIVQPQSGLAPNTRFKVLYNPDTIQLTLVARSLATLAQDSALRSNAVAFGTALDLASAYGELASGELLPLFAEFDGMTQAQVAGALASLSGDMHAHILESTESILRASDEMVMTAASGGWMIGGVDRELNDGTRVWGRAEASVSSYDPDAAGFGFDEDVYGLTLGATILNTPEIRAGVAGSYKTVELYNDTANGATSHMLSVYAYGSRTVTARLTLSGLLGYTEASPKVSRVTPLSSGLAFTKSGKPVSTTHAQLEARYRLVNAGETSVYAIGGLRTAFMNTGAYRETGNIDHAKLTLEAESRHTTQTNLGAEVARFVAGTDFSLFGTWARDIGDDPTVERAARLGEAVWQIQSTDRDLDTFTYGFNASRNI